MRDNTTIHTLARPEAKSGKIRFIHRDGTEHTYHSCVNDLSGSRLSWFDSDLPTIGEDLSDVRATFKSIRKQAKVLEVIGDF